MRILLDECIDRRLARGFVNFEVKTVPQMGWTGTLDGDLLPLVAAEFDVFITVDRNLPYQQNLTKLDLAVLVLEAPSNRLADLEVGEGKF
jgi:PIN like domain